MFWGAVWSFFCQSEWKLGVVAGWAPFTEIIGSISVAQIRLDLVHMGTHGPAPASTALHSSRDGGSCGHSSGWAGLVLQQLNEHAHLWAQPWHHAGPNAVHCVLIAVHQALEQLTVKPRTTRQSVMCLFQEAKGGKLYYFFMCRPYDVWIFIAICIPALAPQPAINGVGATICPGQNLGSPPSLSFCVHSQTAIPHVLGQQKGNIGN